MKKLLLSLAFLFAFCTPAFAAPSFNNNAGLRAYATNIDANHVTGINVMSSSAAISLSGATTTELVALSSGAKIWVTAYNVISAGTGTFKFVYGSGTNCGTGTTDLTGAYSLTAQAGIAHGDGMGALLVVPAGKALCATYTGSVQMSGSVSYVQAVQIGS